MRTATEWYCDTRDHPEFPGCEQKAALVWFCVVEGREIALCHSCNRAWRERAKADTGFGKRCPLCVHTYVAARDLPVIENRAGLPVPPLTGPIADSVDFAMYQEGLLVDVRQRVLRRMATDPKLAAFLARFPAGVLCPEDLAGRRTPRLLARVRV